MRRTLCTVAFLVSACAIAPTGVRAADLLHRYSFSEGVSDSAGNVDGALMGGAKVAGGKLVLDGASGYVQFPVHLVPFSGSYSIAYAATAQSLANGYMEHISQGFSNGPGFYMGCDYKHQMRMTDTWTNTKVQYPDDGLMHYFVLVSDAEAQLTSLFIDGHVRANLEGTLDTTAGGTPTRLGRQFDPYAEYFAGTLDDVRIYRGVLTAEEIEALVCPADFDRDGFITGQDFDLFVLAFEAGELTADFDGDGFVSGIDFDAYVVDFEAGCS